MSELSINPADPNGRQLIEKRKVEQMQRVKQISQLIVDTRGFTPAFQNFLQRNPWIADK